MPTIFSSSPMEAHIIAVFLRAQTAMTTFFRGTPVFRGLLFAALTWAILHQFLRIASSRHEANQAIITIVYRIAMVFLSISLMTWARNDVTFANIDGQWAQYSAIQTDPRYELTLRGQNTALWAYTLLHGALDGVAQESTKAAAYAFEDDSLTRDPMFVVRQLERMSAFTLDPQTASDLVALARDCGETGAGQIATLGKTSLQDMLDLTLDGCQDKWRTFQTDFAHNGDDLMGKIPPSVVTRLGTLTGRSNAELEQIALNFALHRTVQDILSVSPEASPEADAAASGGGAGGEGQIKPNLGTAFLKRFAMMNSIGSYAPKGEQSDGQGAWERLVGEFQNVAPIIPAARAYLEGILAVLFVIVAYTVGFGTWKFMRMWLLAEASMCLYRPVALLGYKVSQYFLLQGRLNQALEDAGIDGTVVGGATILHQQITNLQAIYAAFEVGAFLTFCVGAFALFRQLGGLAWRPQPFGGNGDMGGRGGGNGERVPIAPAATVSSYALATHAQHLHGLPSAGSTSGSGGGAGGDDYRPMTGNGPQPVDDSHPATWTPDR
jgi:hypothetical protein